MSFAPSFAALDAYPSAFISLWSREGGAADAGTSAPASATYVAAQRAHYYPIWIPRPTVIYRFFWLNGATASTDNVQVGLYNSDFTAHTLGTSTLAAGANACQFDNVTDFVVGTGNYYLAIWASGTTTTLFRSINAAAFDQIVVYQESSLAGGLPSTATPVQAAGQYVPVFGMTTVASP